jgi:hypothetical protein
MKLCEMVEIDLETRALKPGSGVWRCPACGLVIRNDTRPIARCGPIAQRVKKERREAILGARNPCRCGQLTPQQS